MMSGPQNSGRPLEDHLRNLILNNTEDGPTNVANQPLGTSDLDAPDKSKAVPQRPVKKRPNQAQRRQMSSQTTIDIDVRAIEPSSSRHQVSHQGFERGPLNDHYHSPDHHSRGHRGGFHQGHHRGHHHGHRGGHHPPHPHQHHHHHHHHHHGRQWDHNGEPLIAQPNQQQDWRQSSGRGGIPTRGVNVVQADTFVARPPRNSRGGLYNPEGHRQYVVRPEELVAQSELLEQLCTVVVQTSEIEYSEILEKEDFRRHVEAICRAVVSDHEIMVNGVTSFQPEDVQLRCFGSLASGFATKAADMDLGLLSPASQIPADAPESPIPRLIERALLDAGFGARLLTRTRVPIIKLCARPTPQLRSDLLEERLKWEQGLAEDEVGFADEELFPNPQSLHVHEKEDTANTIVETSPETTKSSKGDVVTTAANSGKAQSISTNRLLASIKQSRDQTLIAYHNHTKKVLRQLNGRDVTHSNLGVFTEADFLLLDDVSEAFVEGLFDTELKERVKMLPSFSLGKQVPNYRTLHGVCNLVEGENLVMLWEKRTILDGDPRAEQAHSKTVRWWTELHQTRHFGLDPLAFNREMFISLERLRSIPSVQLIQLQQDQYESAADYYDRAAKIMAQLDIGASARSEPGLPPLSIQYYVSGIYDTNIRRLVEVFVQKTDTKSIRVVGRRHRSLHLADEYARALDKGGLYHPDDIPSVEEYIRFLRSEMTPSINSDGTKDYKLPIEGALLPLYRKILKLPNPALSTQNQPKDKYHDKLAFPQSGVGVQCDVNFSAHLALQNSHLLRCYAATDPRVRPMVLFVKHWAKARDINTPYRGTLSSYGYVLMVVHYLINIAQPFVCPNLQLLTPPDPDLPPEVLEGVTTCKGRNVRFWRDEQEIQRMSSEGVLNANQDSVGHLLRGFFEYYAQNNVMSTTQKRGFDWGRDVISIRTPGGILSKQEKNWVQARTTMQTQMGAPPTPDLETQSTRKSPLESKARPSTKSASPTGHPLPDDGVSKPDQGSKPQELKEVRHRFLFAIEDPFEHEHNVARTVTHHGIVSIRDEFRRAWRIIKLAGKDAVQEDLLENVKARAEMLERKQFGDLLAEIHGNIEEDLT